MFELDIEMLKEQGLQLVDSAKKTAQDLADKGKNKLDLLNQHPGPVLLSGYDSKLYNDRLSGWHKESIPNLTQSGQKRKEVLWMNFTPPKQLSLFE